MEDTERIQMDFLDIKKYNIKNENNDNDSSYHLLSCFIYKIIFLHNDPMCYVDTFIFTFAQKMKLRLRKLKNLF